MNANLTKVTKSVPTLCGWSKADCKFGDKCRYEHANVEKPKVFKKSVMQAHAAGLSRNELTRSDVEKMLEKYADRVSKLEAKQLTKGKLAKAADLEEAPATKVVCKYLASLIDPTIGSASIPDSVMVSHVRKQVVSSANVTVPAGTTQGMFVLYPNYSGKIVGCHYIFSSGSWALDQMLFISQELADSFDYVRKVSQKINLQVTTIAAGQFALSGTFNSIRLDGTLSEIPQAKLTYDGILGAVTNDVDRVANVPVAEGIVVLSSPVMDEPFVRLNDISPINVSYDSDYRFAKVVDTTSSLLYPFSLQPIAGLSLSSTASVFTITTLQFNCDIIDWATVSGNLNLAIAANTSSNGCNVTAVASCYGPFGNLVASAQLVSTNIANGVSNLSVRLPFSDILVRGAKPTVGSITSVSIVAYGQMQGGVGNFSISGGSLSGFVSVSKAARAADQNLIAIVAYSNVAVGSNISISTISNFEAIPNAVLRQNAETKIAHSEPGIQDYVRTLLANRDKLGLRTVWAATDYSQERAKLLDLAVMNSYGPMAKSLDWKGILRTAKEKLLPILYKVVPEAKLAADAGQAIWDRFKPTVRAASGTLTARAANLSDNTELLIEMLESLSQQNYTNLEFSNMMSSTVTTLLSLDLTPIQEMRVLVAVTDRYSVIGLSLDPNVFNERQILKNSISQLLETLPQEDFFINLLKLAGDVEENPGPIAAQNIALFRTLGRPLNVYAVPFPVIFVEEKSGIPTITGGSIYLAVKGAYPELTAGNDFVQAGRSKVYGWTNTTADLDLPFDCTLVPVVWNSGSPEVAIGPLVSEHSCEFALTMLAKGISTLRICFTGEIDSVGNILPVGGMSIKRTEAHNLGMALMSNPVSSEKTDLVSENVDVAMQIMSKLVSLPKFSPLKLSSGNSVIKNTSKNAKVVAKACSITKETVLSTLKGVNLTALEIMDKLVPVGQKTAALRSLINAVLYTLEKEGKVAKSKDDRPIWSIVAKENIEIMDNKALDATSEINLYSLQTFKSPPKFTISGDGPFTAVLDLAGKTFRSVGLSKQEAKRLVSEQAYVSLKNSGQLKRVHSEIQTKILPEEEHSRVQTMQMEYQNLVELQLRTKALFEQSEKEKIALKSILTNVQAQLAEEETQNYQLRKSLSKFNSKYFEMIAQELSSLDSELAEDTLADMLKQLQEFCSLYNNLK